MPTADHIIDQEHDLTLSLIASPTGTPLIIYGPNVLTIEQAVALRDGLTKLVECSKVQAQAGL